MSIQIDQNTIRIVAQYFLPGYWTLIVFMHLTNKKTGKDAMFILALAVGYILNFLADSLRSFLHSTFLGKTMLATMNDNAVGLFTAMLIGTGCALALVAINNARWFSRLMIKLFNKTPNQDIWFDVIDFKRGASAKIYEKDGNGYIGGNICHIEKEGDETWIALSMYYKKESGQSKDEMEDHRKDGDGYYVQRTSRIEHIELFNNKPEEKKCWFRKKRAEASASDTESTTEQTTL